MKKISIKGYQKKLEHMFRDYVIIRDGGRCQVCGATSNLVADHVFSRAVKSLFFELDNLICVCQTCNGKKNWDRNATRYRVYELCRYRIGDQRFARLAETAINHKPFPEFSKRYYLEAIENYIRGLK